MIIAASTVDQVMEDFEIEVSIHKKYSGRGMYSQNCLAIEYRNLNDVFKFMFELACQLGADDSEGSEDQDEYSIRDNIDELFLAQPSRMDNLGNNGLIYWPHIQISE